MLWGEGDVVVVEVVGAAAVVVIAGGSGGGDGWYNWYNTSFKYKAGGHQCPTVSPDSRPLAATGPRKCRVG